jgi:hypothetical protein
MVTAVNDHLLVVKTMQLLDAAQLFWIVIAAVLWINQLKLWPSCRPVDLPAIKQNVGTTVCADIQQEEAMGG